MKKTPTKTILHNALRSWALDVKLFCRHYYREVGLSALRSLLLKPEPSGYYWYQCTPSASRKLIDEFLVHRQDLDASEDSLLKSYGGIGVALESHVKVTGIFFDKRPEQAPFDIPTIKKSLTTSQGEVNAHIITKKDAETYWPRLAVDLSLHEDVRKRISGFEEYFQKKLNISALVTVLPQRRQDDEIAGPRVAYDSQSETLLVGLPFGGVTHITPELHSHYLGSDFERIDKPPFFTDQMRVDA